MYLSDQKMPHIGKVGECFPIQKNILQISLYIEDVFDDKSVPTRADVDVSRKNCNMAIWNFSENSSVLVSTGFTKGHLKLVGCI